MMLKNRLCRLANWEVVKRRRPVLRSATAPVALWYRLRASEAMSTSVVPVSTIPAVVDKIEVEVP